LNPAQRKEIKNGRTKKAEIKEKIYFD